MAQPGFIFGAGTGETAESLARKRAVAQRMIAGGGSAPRNVGEGIARIGEALAGAYISRKAGDAQKRGAEDANKAFQSIFGGMSGEDIVAPMPPNQSQGINPIETQPLPPPDEGWSADKARAALAGLPDIVQDMESGGDPAAVSPKGAGGLMQIMPATARDPGYGVPTIYDMAQQAGVAPPPPPEAGDEAMTAWLADPANAEVNRQFGEAYLGAMGEQHGGDPALTLAAYNAGPGAVQQYGGVPPFAETQGYVQNGVAALGGHGGAQPANAAPAPAPQAAGPDQARIAQIAQVLQHPFINPGQKAIAEQLLQAELAKAQPAMSPYQQAQLDLAQRRLEAQISGKIGGQNITVNANGEPSDTALRKKLDEKTGESWAKFESAGAVSAAAMQDFAVLDELIKIAPSGPLTGRLAEMFPGFSSAGAAFEAITKRLAPTFRVEGSGSTSDIEYEGMLKSLPQLRNRPEANMLISRMMQEKAKINIERAEIVNAYSRGDMTAAEARRQIGEMNKRSIMSPELAALIKGVDEKSPGVVIDGYTIEEVE